MENTKNMKSPLVVVGDVILDLQRLANLCSVMSMLKDRSDELTAEEVGDTMGLLRDALDRQVKALDAIQLPRAKMEDCA